MHKIFTPKTSNDPGIGTAFSSGRVIDKDGNLNITRRGDGFSFRNLYHYLINMTWIQFFLLVFGMFILLNSIFAFIYLAAGLENIHGSLNGTASENFLQAFFFSAQTFTTVGYGVLAPGGTFTNFIASAESLTGLMSFALITGILYGRFSRPSARIIFSDQAVIAPYQDFKAFMIRIVNGRSNQMTDMKATMLLTQMEGPEGQKKRTYVPLKLERNAISMFPLPWTIVHPIDEESPFSGRTKNELKEAGFEVLVLIQGYDDTFSQNVHARHSYNWEEIIWNAKFVPVQSPNEKGGVFLDVNRVGEYELVPESPSQALGSGQEKITVSQE